MKILPALSCGGLVFVAGCAGSFLPYHPKTDPEKIEFQQNSLDVYPQDVRQNPGGFKEQPVAWAGIVRESKAVDTDEGTVRIHTVLDHHYFDWQQNQGAGGTQFSLSPRGEGEFQIDWVVQKIDPDAELSDAEQFAAPGKVAMVYGTPIGVDTNGVVKLKYRYLRMVDPAHYTLGEFDYGRFGEPYVYLK